ncbi:pyrroline-5-carboxylate reductase [Archangium lansingense]|uniref:Pyrroline-5-carboxylate reductase n=1 Tax=Archangium lansingense TaxID=2995310 RepID=A0ABT4AF04_9BACT|nr:pyrroline-5-carboxylate reductase [Archangium lansinium]MCY1079477.1 pyrroline-5-carboxylate reductase [Archangium lansinium]
MTADSIDAAVPSRRPALGFIGGGVMAEALIGAVIGSCLAAPGAILVGEVDEDRRRVLREQHGVEVTADNLAAAAAELVVLAVKPQQLGAVLQQLRGQLREDTIVVSIIAGARLQTLCEGLEHPLVVRAMPNTPARVRKAATFWSASAGLSKPALLRVRSLLGAFGTELEVADEAGVEMATGLAGPMPAFVFFLIEAFIDAGVALGLPREQATLATVESMRGSLELLHRTQESPEALRKQVTSPGGATLAGLRVFESAGVRETMGAAVRAVHARAQELGRLPLAPLEPGKEG